MPFNSSGVYQLVYDWTDDRDNNIKILAERMDGQHGDIEAAINEIVEGNVDFRGTLAGVFGTAAAPTYSFQGDAGSGLYRVSAGVLGFSVGGVKIAELSATGLDVSGNLSAVDGAFTGNLSAVDGAFTGNLSAVDGAFTGNLSAPTPATSDNSTKVATTNFVQTAIGGINLGKIKKIHVLQSDTSYVRTGMTEANMSNDLTFYPAATNTRFLILATARVMVRNTAGGNNARADLRLSYYHTADAAYKPIEYGNFGAVNVTPYGSGNANFFYGNIPFLHDASQNIKAHGSPPIRVSLRLRGEAGYSNNEVNMYDWNIIVWEYET